MSLRSSRWPRGTSSPPAPRAGSGTPASHRGTLRLALRSSPGLRVWANAATPAWRADAMRIAIAGGGPGGLFLAALLKKAAPDHEVTVFERNRAEDTFGFGVVFS